MASFIRALPEFDVGECGTEYLLAFSCKTRGGSGGGSKAPRQGTQGVEFQTRGRLSSESKDGEAITQSPLSRFFPSLFSTLESRDPKSKRYTSRKKLSSLFSFLPELNLNRFHLSRFRGASELCQDTSFH